MRKQKRINPQPLPDPYAHFSANELQNLLRQGFDDIADVTTRYAKSNATITHERALELVDSLDGLIIKSRSMKRIADQLETTLRNERDERIREEEEADKDEL